MTAPAAPSYIVTPVARDLIKALDRGDELIACYGGMRSGKTWAITLACLTLCQTRRELNIHTGEVKPIEILITRSTFGQIKASFMPSFRAIIEPLGAEYIQEPGNTRWIMPNGSIIHWRAYRLHSTQGESESSIEGLGFSVVFGDEATQYPDAFFGHTLERTSQASIHVVTGQRYMASQAVWLSRPASDIRFLEIAQTHHKAGMSGCVIISQTRDCQTPEYMAKLARTHSKPVFDAITQDVPWSTVPATGVVYPRFEAITGPDGNLYDGPVEHDHPTYVLVDTGNNTTSILWAQIREVYGSPALLIVDEWHPDGATSTRHLIAEIKRRPWAVSELIIDPAGKARQRAAHMTSEVMILRRQPDEDPDGLGGGLGVPVRATITGPRRLVEEGIIRVDARICAADGTRSLYVVRHLWDKPPHFRGIRHTIQNYRRCPKSGEPLKGAPGSNADHCADALRYGVVHLAWDGPPQLDKLEPQPPKPARAIPPRKFAFTRRAHRQRR